jgi:hypothetical protein
VAGGSKLNKFFILRHMEALAKRSCARRHDGRPWSTVQPEELSTQSGIRPPPNPRSYDAAHEVTSAQDRSQARHSSQGIKAFARSGTRTGRAPRTKPRQLPGALSVAIRAVPLSSTRAVQRDLSLRDSLRSTNTSVASQRRPTAISENAGYHENPAERK